jgi:hypothetical protein
MKSIKKALFGLVLAGCAVTNAFALPVYDYQDAIFVPADDTGPGTLQTWLFGAGGAGVLAGQTFSYEFVFNTPPSAPTTWFGFHVGGGSTVAFDTAAFFGLGDPLTVPDYGLSFTPTRVDGHGFLDSGTYDLVLAGTFLTDGASFLGRAVDDIAPVPEPMTPGLMLAGAAALLVARRRARSTARSELR